MRRLLFLALTAMVLASCGDAVTDREEFRGIYSIGFETSAFNPCDLGDNELWWVVNDPGLDPEFYEGIDPDTGSLTLYLEVRGSVGAEGEFGHLGAYNRELEIGEVLEARQGGC